MGYKKEINRESQHHSKTHAIKMRQYKLSRHHFNIYKTAQN